jgi:hypothetical protein
MPPLPPSTPRGRESEHEREGQQPRRGEARQGRERKERKGKKGRGKGEPPVTEDNYLSWIIPTIKRIAQTLPCLVPVLVLE